MRNKKGAPPKKVLSVWIAGPIRDRFEDVCQMSGLNKAEVVESLIEWFMNTTEDSTNNKEEE